MKNILIFNDISGLGNCSLVANLPIFTKLGHYCMPVVTATYSCQTGFEHFTCQKNASLLQCARDVLGLRKPDVAYVGFCADSGILSQVIQVVQDADFDLFVDPILGDNGRMYSVFDDAYLQQMKQLVRRAKCISPNLTEACLLADVNYAELMSHANEPAFLATCGKAFANFLQHTGAQNAVITGVPCGNLIGNIVLQQDSTHYVTNERVSVNYSGTGDTFSSVLLGKLLCGCNLLQATQIAANFVAKSAASTHCPDRRYGVEFSQVMHLLD